MAYAAGGREAAEGARRSGEARAWLVRHKVKGQARLDRWLSDGYASIGWRELGPEALTATREELTALTQKIFADDSPGRLRASVGNVYRFLHQVRAGDLVVTTDGDAIYIGVFTSAAEYAPDDDESYWRGVEWLNAAEPASRRNLSESAYSKLRTLLTVSDVSGDAAEFAELAGIDVDVAEETAAPLPPKRVAVAHLPDADSELAESLLLPEPWLQDVIELLRSKRQLILYGPPGTGKTFIAQRLADHLTQLGGTYTLVQFHPSYAYEDFFEGFRPRASGSAGGISFELVPGPLRRIAEQAADDLENPYILLIDEINRANLAKVFGELYFLLEYRERSMALQYSPEDEFALPKNLYFIGTMNTADRSIARIDAAMRRRFMFMPLFPEQFPIDQLLDRWLAREGRGREAGELLTELNRRIDDPDATVGPSYLMTGDVDREGGLDRIWHHAILPLLEEHFLGSGIDVRERFGLPALRLALSAAPEIDIEDVDQPAGPA